MLTSASVISHPYDEYGPTSLVEGLFAQAGRSTRLVSTPTSEVRCDYCARKAFSLIGDCLTIEHRHGTQYHRTVIPIFQLGLKRIDG